MYIRVRPIYIYIKSIDFIFRVSNTIQYRPRKTNKMRMLRKILLSFVSHTFILVPKGFHKMKNTTNVKLYKVNRNKRELSHIFRIHTQLY